MTTTVKVTAGETRAKVAELMLVGDEVRTTNSEIEPGDERSFVLHNTLDLVVSGDLAEVVVTTTDWPVRVISNAIESDPIERGDGATIVLDKGEMLTLTERPAPEPAAGE